MDFGRVSNIEQRIKYIVFGYVKQLKEKQDDNNIINIPQLILQTCLLFYYEHEYFTVHGSKMKHNKKCNIVTMIGDEDGYNTIYGNVNITNNIDCIYKWDFKIIKKTNSINIGIDSSNKQICENIFSFDWINKDTYYAYSSGGNRKTNGESIGWKYGEKYKTGDVVSMELNALDKTLKFYRNNKDFGIAYKNIDFSLNKRYNIAVMMYQKGDSIQLINFKQTNID